MSQSQKKSGAQNISDLKARLGLKKGGPAARKDAVPPPGGIVPPPGLANQQRSVPAPPGAKQPEPAMPSVSDDPFAAMNAMAAAGVAHQQATAGPQIIIVNDGKPVESVEQTSRFARIGKIAAIVALPFIFGSMHGQCSNNAKLVNRTIEDAGILRDDIKRLRRSALQSIQDELLRSRERGPGSQAFPPNDEELTKKLGEKTILPVVDPQIPFESNLYYLDPGIVSEILTFYSNAITIGTLVEEHVKATKNDVQAMEDGEKRIQVTKPDQDTNRYLKFYRYGVIMEIPEQGGSDAPFGAKLVEIGPPVCQDRKASSTGKCEGPPIGFGVRERLGDGSGWALTEAGFFQDNKVQGKQVLPLLPTEAFEAVTKGADSAVAERAYMRRIQKLNDIVSQTIELGASLEARLDAKASEGKAFTYFM